MVKRRREPEVQPYTALLASQVQELQTEVGSIVQMLSDIQNAMAATNTAQAMATNQTPIDPDQAYAMSMGFAPMYQQSVQAAADRAFQLKLQEEQQKFQTAERVASQQFQASERAAAQTYQTAERAAAQTFQASEREAAQTAQEDLTRLQSQITQEAQLGFKLRFTVPESTDPTSTATEPVLDEQGNKIRWTSQSELDLFLRALDRRTQRGIEKRQQEFTVAQAEASAAGTADRTDPSQYLGDTLASRIPDDKKTPLYNACKDGDTNSAVYRQYNLEGAMIYNTDKKTFHRSVCDAVNVNSGSYNNLYYLRENEYKAALDANNEQGPYTPEELAARGTTGATAVQAETQRGLQRNRDAGCPLQNDPEVATCEQAGLAQHEDGVRGHCYDEDGQEVSTYYVSQYDQCPGLNDTQGGETRTSASGTTIWNRGGKLSFQYDGAGPSDLSACQVMALKAGLNPQGVRADRSENPKMLSCTGSNYYFNMWRRGTELNNGIPQLNNGDRINNILRQYRGLNDTRSVTLGNNQSLDALIYRN